MGHLLKETLNPPPPSNNTVRVRMVDTTSVMSLHAEGFVYPVMPGHEIMSVTTMAFLIEHERLGKKAMFDLGTRKGYWNCPPMTLQRIKDAIPGVRIEKDVTEILQEKGMPQLHNDEVDPSTLNKTETPFYQLSTHKHSSYKDPALAKVTTAKMQQYFDSDPNVLVLLAHDTALVDLLPVFNDEPEKDINDWQELGMNEKCHWRWLGELPRYDKDGDVVGQGYREIPIVEGLWKDGRRVADFED